MKKEVQLLPEQIEKIQKMLDETKQQRKDLIEIYKETNAGIIYQNQGFSDVVDSSYVSTITNLESKKIRLEGLLKEAKVISEYNEESISIGTRFVATCDYNGDMETAEYILVSTKEGSTITKNRKENDAICITIESPFGKAVLGKRIGDSFYYQSPTMAVAGFIEGIIPKEEVLGIQKVK